MFLYLVFFMAFLFVIWLVKNPFAYWGLTSSMLFYSQTVPLLVSTKYFLSELLNTSNMRLDWLARLSSLWGGSLCILPMNSFWQLLQPIFLPTMFLMHLFFIWFCNHIFILARYPKREWKVKRKKGNHKYINTLWNIGYISYLGVTMCCYNILLGKEINGKFVVAASPSIEYLEWDHL